MYLIWLATVMALGGQDLPAFAAFVYAEDDYGPNQTSDFDEQYCIKTILR